MYSYIPARYMYFQTNLKGDISAMFLHLSKQCLYEGGLASSNLTHHSHQLTWLHSKVQTEDSNRQYPRIHKRYKLSTYSFSVGLCCFLLSQ